MEGYSMLKLRSNAAAVSAASRTLTPRNVTSSAYFWLRSARSGASTRQGAHAAYQKFTRVGPSRDSVEMVSPSKVSPENSTVSRSEEHTSELQSRGHLVCRLLLEKKKNTLNTTGREKSYNIG